MAGQSIVVEERYGEAQPDRLRALAAEFVRLGVDVIVTDGGRARLAARQATATIPIVVAVAADLVGIDLRVRQPASGADRSFAAARRLPAISGDRRHAEAGGLMSHGPSLRNLSRRAAIQVGRILKGARPADLPVAQPTKFEMVINMRAAKALGLGIPASVLVRADERIE